MAKKNLADRACTACTPKSRPLAPAKAQELLTLVPGWKLGRGGRLRRSVRFEDFLTCMEFVNELADLAEEQKHHPDFRVSWSKLDLELWTHVAGGVTENDFILAAKINGLLGERA